MAGLDRRRVSGLHGVLVLGSRVGALEEREEDVMGKTWDTQTGISPYEAAHPYAVKLERENCKLREERDLYHKQADALWAALERIVDANGRDGRAIARGVMERLRRGT